MIEIYKNIFVGSENDYYSITNIQEWAILHCCKHPFHCSFVGYKGSLASSHPDYALKRLGNEMALNLVDMDKYSANYLDFNKSMFEKVFNFLDEYRVKDYKILIHCNQGESRAPTLAMLYVAKLGGYGYKNFEDTVEEFRLVYPNYQPKTNIYLTVQNLWTYFVKK